MNEFYDCSSEKDIDFNYIVIRSGLPSNNTGGRKNVNGAKLFSTFILLV